MYDVPFISPWWMEWWAVNTLNLLNHLNHTRSQLDCAWHLSGAGIKAITNRNRFSFCLSAAQWLFVLDMQHFHFQFVVYFKRIRMESGRPSPGKSINTIYWNKIGFKSISSVLLFEIWENLLGKKCFRIRWSNQIIEYVKEVWFCCRSTAFNTFLVSRESYRNIN